MEIKTDNKSKFIVIIIILGIMTSITFCYYFFLLKQDYILYGKVSCNPSVESCFKDFDSDEVYKIVLKNASSAPICSIGVGSCKELSCENGENGCTVMACSDVALKDYDISGSCVDEK